MYNQQQQQIITFLRQLSNFPEGQLEHFIKLLRPHTLKKNEHLVEAGQKPTGLGFVTSGLMRLYYINEAGEEFTKSFCPENQFIGAYSALLLDEPAQLYIQALEDTHSLVIPFREYQAFAADQLCWEIVNRKLAENLFIKKERRESSLLLEDAQTRYLNFLREYTGLENRVKQHHIASYLGITPVSLSRIRAQLKTLT